MHMATKFQLRKFLLCFGLVYFSSLAMALPLVESVTGEVSVVNKGQQYVLRTGISLDNGSIISSAKGASAVIRFDDGQVVVLASSSVLKLENYKFVPDRPRENSSDLELVRGAMRFVSGALGKQTPDAVKIKAQTATIGIRGTDFMVATGSLYITVGDGGVVLTNSTGTYFLEPGTLWEMASPQAIPTIIGSQQLPNAAASYFESLKSIQISGVVTPNSGVPGYEVVREAAGSLTLQGGALGSLSLTPLSVTAAGVAAAVAISAGQDGATGTTGTTGTLSQQSAK